MTSINTHSAAADLCKEIRRKRKITQRELAQLIGVNRRTIIAWENEEWEPQAPTLKLLNYIANSIQTK